MASARARMPRPEAFSERKSSSMMMTGKWKRMAVPQKTATRRSGSQNIGRNCYAKASDLRQGDADLPLVFAAAILVGGFADFVGLEEEHLCAALASVDLGGQRRGVGKLQGHVAFPFRLEGRDVDDDAAARVGALAQADGEHAARDAEVFDRAC